MSASRRDRSGRSASAAHRAGRFVSRHAFLSLVLALLLGVGVGLTPLPNRNAEIRDLRASQAATEAELREALTHIREQDAVIAQLRADLLEAERVNTDLRNQVDQLQRELKAKRELPSYVGKKKADVQNSIEDIGWRLVVKRQSSSAAPGTILAQSPAPGTLMKLNAKVTLPVAKKPPCDPAAYLGNPWCFNFASGKLIYQSNTPADFCLFFECIGDFSTQPGYIVQCNDGTFSHSGGIGGSCSSHDGNWRALLDPR